MNADAKNAYAQAQTICAAGTPTNAIAAGVDILAVESALLPYFKKARPRAKSRDRQLLRRERNSGAVGVWRVSRARFGDMPNIV